LALLAACQATSQDAPAAPTAETQTPPDQVIAGGYGTANEENPELEKARKLAIEELYTRFPSRALVERVTSEVQVVAGVNYKFLVEMSGAPDQRNRYEIVVFRSLDGKMRVTDVRKLNGAE
jgi:hypothetical protein